MKPTTQELMAALQTMRLSIKFIPESEEATALFLLCLKNMVSTKEQLDWLTYNACCAMTKWSLPDLRGIFCSRYTPADGLNIPSSLPGYTPRDLARRNEAIELDESRVLAPAPETPPTEEELQEWAELDTKIKAAAKSERLQPRKKMAPRLSRMTRAELRDAEADVARLAATRVLDQAVIDREVRELEVKLGIARSPVN